ncbi:MAG TPA: hypothetical protein ENJ89_04445 [Caldithrix abyssi]|uniref:Aminopeptidase N n=1 Tax=Caldithrix abyssi TaxID=187145 RepID=A0A7V5UEN4_CALAY|nr:hypothetical protein [Caldithrix abyssi]
MLQRIFVSILLFSFFLAHTSRASKKWREHTYDVQHYRIEVRFNMNAQTVIGRTTLLIRPLRSKINEVQLDAHKFNIQSITINQSPADTFTVGEDHLDIRLGRSFERDSLFMVQVDYTCQPERGLYFFRPDSANPDQPLQIWSQGEGEDNHYWFPCYDSPNDKATVEMVVEVDSGLTAVSNGHLAGKIERRGKTIFDYQFNQPAPVYLISLVVGKYVKYTQRYKDIPVEYYVYPRHSRQDALRSFGRTPDMIKFFSDFTRFDYPYPKYAQTIISNFMYGGMENISATTQTDRTMHDERAHLNFESDGLVAHELAHQWFGDLITCRDWSDIWLNEGFATYFTNLYYEHWRGYPEFRYRQYGAQKAVIRAETEKPRQLSGEHPWGQYIKGASVLHMLRQYLGDQLFQEGIKTYVHRHAFGLAESSDLRQAFEDATGYNLFTFFEQWVYGKGIPQFNVRSQYQPKQDSLILWVDQMQDSAQVRPEFEARVLIGLRCGKQYREVPVTIKRRHERFAFRCRRQPDFIVFDAGQTLLKTLRFDQPPDNWLAQYRFAPRMIDRVQALSFLEKDSTGQDKSAKYLLQTAVGKEFYGLRLESLKALSRMKHLSQKSRQKIGRALLKAVEKEKDARVRRQIIAAMKKFPVKKQLPVLRRLFKNDLSYHVQAAALNTLCYADSLHALTYIRQGLDTDSWDEIVRNAALGNLKFIPDSTALDVAGRYLFYGTHPKLRQAAVREISRIAKAGNERAKDLLLAVVKEGKEHNRYRPLSYAIRTLVKLKDLRLLPVAEKFTRQRTNRYLKSASAWAIKKLRKEKMKTL